MEKKHRYQQGNRNNFVYHFACNCKREDLEKEYANQIAHQLFDLLSYEIDQVFKSAYNLQAQRYGANSKRNGQEMALDGIPLYKPKEATYFDVHEYLEAFPLLRKPIYNGLPTLLPNNTFAEAKSFDSKSLAAKVFRSMVGLMVPLDFWLMIFQICFRLMCFLFSWLDGKR